MYDCITQPGPIFLNSHSLKVISLFVGVIRFSTLVKQYKKLNEEFNLHKTGFKHPLKHRHCKTLCDHFINEIFQGAKYWVKVIEKQEGGWGH